MSSLVGLEVSDDGVAVVHMADDLGKNAFSRSFVDELVSVLERLGEPSVKVAVIRGLPDVFSAGGDQSVLMGLAEGNVAPYDLFLTRTILDVPVPTIAAMAGHAVGGGLIFGLSCDIALMGSSSNYGCNFLELGFTPGMGTTRLLQAAVGEYLAAEMMFGCQYFRGSHFAGRSNINDVLEPGRVEKRAMKIARRIADKPRKAITLLKRSLSLPRKRTFEEARTMESFMHEICFSDPETIARIRDNYGTGAQKGAKDGENS